MFAGSLLKGTSQSCGCVRSEITRLRNQTHGLSKTPEYRIWAGMKKRCYNTNAKAYKDYGGRGIRVCPQWRDDFPQFLADVGHRPSQRHSIGRTDNDGDYTPQNVQWETPFQQAQTKRNVRYIQIGSNRVRASLHAQTHGMTALQYRKRIHRGWTTENAACAPLRAPKQINHAGQTHTLAQWAELTSISIRTLRARLYEKHWTVERALTAPLGG